MVVRFLLDGEVVELEEVEPTATVLDFLRYRLRRTGTKEGCAEGDCGACTMLVGELEDEGIAWRAVNACILFLPMVDGRALMTVESLSRDGKLTDLQRRMAENGSSQCGFCTPGFVMSLYGRTIGASGSTLPVTDVIAGNLCRCTGYGPIIEAGEGGIVEQRDDSATAKALASLQSGEMASGSWKGRVWFAPRTAEQLVTLMAEQPDARLVAGATDVGLWVTKKLQALDNVIFLGGIEELRRIEETESGVTIGAMVSFTQAHEALARLSPDLGELIRRIGGVQIRNAGTIGGNVANGSPIGDSPPALIALGATLTLRGASGRRTIPLEDYFLGYGKQDRQAGEFVESLFVPRPADGSIVHVYKLSKRFDSDISAVCGAFALQLDGSIIREARIAFGGMAPIPCRARWCEAALAGQPFSLQSLEAAASALFNDYQPLTDVRGTAAYRRRVAANLLKRLWFAEQGEAVSVLDREIALGA